MRRAWVALTMVAVALAMIAIALAWPAAAAAHGLAGRAYLPVPAWLFAWAAGAVLVVSFVALPRMWSSPVLERAVPRRLVGLPVAVEIALGALGVAAFAEAVVGGLAGVQAPALNLAPTAVFVIFWVGIPVASVLLGDVFSFLNPWRALARAAMWASRGARIGRPHPYPQRLGRWPAVATAVAFAWLELVFVDRDHPRLLAALAVAYALAQLVGMAAFGIERWCECGDGFGVAFNLFSRMAVFEYREGAVWLRRPLSGLTRLAPSPGTVALVCSMIGATTFDGFLNGPVWRAIAPGGTAPSELVKTLALAGCIGVIAGLYKLASRDLAPRFAHSLVPIAFGYLLAHYFSYLITNGQAIGELALHPLHASTPPINYGIVSPEGIWYVQVAALVLGHVSALVLAHDRAIVLFEDPHQAALSQRWMLVVMVTFTSLGLWLLSAVNT